MLVLPRLKVFLYAFQEINPSVSFPKWDRNAYAFDNKELRQRGYDLCRHF